MARHPTPKQVQRRLRNKRCPKCNSVTRLAYDNADDTVLVDCPPCGAQTYSGHTFFEMADDPNPFADEHDV